MQAFWGRKKPASWSQVTKDLWADHGFKRIWETSDGTGHAIPLHMLLRTSTYWAPKMGWVTEKLQMQWGEGPTDGQAGKTYLSSIFSFSLKVQMTPGNSNNGSSNWVPATHMEGPDGVPLGSWLWSLPSLEPSWRLERELEIRTPFLYLTVEEIHVSISHF